MHQRPQAALVAGPAPARLSHRHAQRPPACRHSRHRPAAGRGLQRQRRGELAVRLGPAALGRHRRLAGDRHRRQRGRAALRRHDAPPGEGLPLEWRHLRHRGRCLGRQLLLGRRLAAARERQPRHGRADAQRAACRPTRSSWTWSRQGTWRPAYSRQTDLADSIMTAIVLAPFAPRRDAVHRPRPPARAGMRAGEGAAHRTDQVRCARRGERRHAHRSIPALCMARRSRPTTITASPCASPCWACASRACASAIPRCVRKTFPNFFAKLAELGTVIEDADGKLLSGEELLA